MPGDGIAKNDLDAVGFSPGGDGLFKVDRAPENSIVEMDITEMARNIFLDDQGGEKAKTPPPIGRFVVRENDGIHF